MEKNEQFVQRAVEDEQSPQRSPRSLTGRNQDTTRSQTSSDGEVKMLAHSPCTEVETPTAANLSTLKATAQPFTATPRSSQRQASLVPNQQLPVDQRTHFQWRIPPSGFSSDERVFPPLTHQVQKRRDVVKLAIPAPRILPLPFYTPAALPVKKEPRVSGTLAHIRRKKKKKGSKGHSKSVRP